MTSLIFDVLNTDLCQRTIALLFTTVVVYHISTGFSSTISDKLKFSIAGRLMPYRTAAVRRFIPVYGH